MSFSNIIATSQPLSVQAGINAFRQGGNAVDAALAAAICQTVVEPTMNGIGSDAFAIVWDTKKLNVWNGSGRSPNHWNTDLFSGFDYMPKRGWESVTVPGSPDLWSKLSASYGSLPYENLFADAIEHAEVGFEVTKRVFSGWVGTPSDITDQSLFKQSRYFTNRPRSAGERFAYKDQAYTLRLLAATDSRSFYNGEIAGHILNAGKDNLFSLREEDLLNHSATVEDTIHCDFYGYTVHETKPNSQGFMVLEILKTLEYLEIDKLEWTDWRYHHTMIEAIKLAFADATYYVADLEHMKYSHELFYSDDYIAKRAKQISFSGTLSPKFGVPMDGGTVYLTTADSNGIMVSFIQSNFMGFGSGVVIPKTGISMHNRGAGFTLQNKMANVVGPSKQPYHTILPAFVMKDGEPVFSFGVMGGTYQPQGQAQILTQIICNQSSPKDAIDKPRWRIAPDYVVEFEESFPKNIVEKLVELGHKVRIKGESRFGGAQLIEKSKEGYIGVSDPRKDGYVMEA